MLQGHHMQGEALGWGEAYLQAAQVGDYDNECTAYSTPYLAA